MRPQPRAWNLRQRADREGLGSRGSGALRVPVAVGHPRAGRGVRQRVCARGRAARETGTSRRSAHLAELEIELGNLSKIVLAGVVSSTLANMLAQREQEREALTGRFGSDPVQDATVLPHPALLRRLDQKVGGISAALDEPALRQEVAETIRVLVESVTIRAEGGQLLADEEASTAMLIDLAQNARTPRRSLSGGRSVTVVAGTGFEPVTFRL